jgi:hypothetical protein
MSEAPKTIWASPELRRDDQGMWWDTNPGGDAEEYTRTDSIPSQDDLIRAALEVAAKVLVSDFDTLLRIAGLITQEQNRGASVTNALRAALLDTKGE